MVWQWTQAGEIFRETGHILLTDAEVLLTRSHPTTRLWSQVLGLAIDGDHPTYDTLFITVAHYEKTHVVTFDKQLQDVFPD